jgi:hypothetical protein
MKKLFTQQTEIKCPACDGTGFPTVTQPVQPDRKIYPTPCEECGGKGRIQRPPTEAAFFADLSKIDHTPIIERGHIRMMDFNSKLLTGEEFVSLLIVGNLCSVTEPPAVIPAEHSARLIALGYMADLAGRLRMTTPGRQRIAAGFENRPLPKSNLATEGRTRPVPTGP